MHIHTRIHCILFCSDKRSAKKHNYCVKSRHMDVCGCNWFYDWMPGPNMTICDPLMTKTCLMEHNNDFNGGKITRTEQVKSPEINFKKNTNYCTACLSTNPPYIRYSFCFTSILIQE